MTSLFQRRFAEAEVEDRSEAEQRARRAVHEGISGNELIPAQELPSAADALASLFPEDDDSVKITSAAEPAWEPGVATEEAAPRPRSKILKRLFGSIRARAKFVHKEIADGSTAIAVAEPPEVRESPKQEVTEGSDADFAPASIEEPSICASELPSAAHVLEEIFPDDLTPEEASTQGAADVRMRLPADASETPPDAPPMEQEWSVAANECDADFPAETESISGEQSPALASESACEINDNPDGQPEENSLRERRTHAARTDRGDGRSGNRASTRRLRAPAAASGSPEDPDSPGRSIEYAAAAARAAPRPAYKDWALDDGSWPATASGWNREALPARRLISRARSLRPPK